jgi:DNA invertase Pin-like site-specific DNA recombinase
MNNSIKAALYARVSTVDKDQNPEVQLEQLRRFCNDAGWEIAGEYVDRASASDFIHRKEWTRLMKDASLRKFNVLLLWKLDRGFRSVLDAVGTLEMLNGYNVKFRSYMEPAIDTTTPMGQFVFNISAAWAQLERQNISQRVTAGMEYAKEKGTRSGKAIGRPRKDVDFKIICKAVCDSSVKDPKGSYSEAARIIKNKTGIEVTPGFVQLRLNRQGLTKEQVINSI